MKTQYPSNDSHPQKILIIDSDPRASQALSAVLRVRGFDVEECTTTEQVNNLIDKDNDISVILIDLLFPAMEAFKLIRGIRLNRKYNHITLIGLVQEPASMLITRFRDIGTDDFCMRPIKVNQLCERIGTALANEVGFLKMRHEFASYA